MDKIYGVWPMAVLMIVIASWALYRFVAPKSWKEWRNAGLVQAFIIALYAEMYGFPLTLYVLTGYFGIDVPIAHPSGHLWATLLGYGYIGGVIEMMLGYAFVVLGLGLLAEGWREVYQARKHGRLATGGLYSLVRHPQYTGIFVALFGQLIHWPTILTLLLFPIIVWVYVRLARREERQMAEQFGETYDDYRQHVPMFFPKWGSWRKLAGAMRYSAQEAERRDEEAERRDEEAERREADGKQYPPVNTGRDWVPQGEIASNDQLTHKTDRTTK